MTSQKLDARPSPASENPGEEPSTVLKRRVEALEAEIAELRAYLPMLGRLAFFEDFAGSVPDAILKMQEWMRFDHDEASHCFGPEWTRPRGEPLPAAGQALRDAYTDRTSPGLRRVAS